MKDDPQKVQLSHEDRKEIARYVWEYAKRDLFINAGKGFLSVTWRLLLTGIFVLAIIGYSKGWFHP